MSPPVTRTLESADVPECERILRGLPGWFGVEEANQRYIHNLTTLPAFVAGRNGNVDGFISLRQHNAVTTEIEVLAVDQDAHHQGIGRALIEVAARHARGSGAQLLEVKTLGPSHPDEGYRQTRAFYLATGFLPLEELPLWAPDNPALIMVKILT